MNDIIHFPIRIELSSFKIVKSIGARELVILLFCVLFVLIVLFSGGSAGLLSRLVISVPIAAFVFMASMIPIRGYKVERFLLVLIEYYLAPKIFVHQSARPIEVPVQVTSSTQPPPPSPPPKPAQKKQPIPRPSLKMPAFHIPSIGLNLPRASAFVIVIIFFIITLYSSYVLYLRR